MSRTKVQSIINLPDSEFLKWAATATEKDMDQILAYTDRETDALLEEIDRANRPKRRKRSKSA